MSRRLLTGVVLGIVSWRLLRPNTPAIPEGQGREAAGPAEAVRAVIPPVVEH